MPADPLRPSVTVTGGAGFIGAHLCRRLLAQGHEVVCLDNFFTGSRANIAELLDDKRFEVLRHDVVVPIHLETGQIYNLACPASPVHYQRNPIKTVQANVIGTTNALEAAWTARARLLQASTSEVYGDPTQHPQRESYWGNVNPVGPRSCYDEGKRCAETLCYDYRRLHGLQVRVARIFNTYGPGMHVNDGRVVSNFIVQALANEPIQINGDGSQTRSFCYVSDMVDGLIALMNSDYDDTPVNLGNPQETTILELARQIVELCNSRSTLEHRPAVQDDPVRRRPDISLAQAKLDWQPTVALSAGLKDTIEYFDRLLTTSAR